MWACAINNCSLLLASYIGLVTVMARLVLLDSVWAQPCNNCSSAGGPYIGELVIAPPLLLVTVVVTRDDS